MAKFIARIQDRLSVFWSSRHGNVAVTFALALCPLVYATGAAVDYSRANATKAELQAAADSTALALATNSSSLTSMSSSDLNQAAGSDFKAALSGREAGNVIVGATFSSASASVTVSATATVTTDFLSLMGIPHLDVAASSTTKWGASNLEVALVLDNTGSMNSTDVAPTRIDALKTAVAQFLNTMQAAAGNGANIQVAIVPFTNGVNVGTQNVNASWLDWSYYSNSGGAGFGSHSTSANNNYNTNPTGQYYYDPYNNNYTQYTSSCAGWSSCWSTSATTPNWTGGSQNTSWNGGACYWSSCWAGSGAWSTTATTSSKDGWQGCVMDRDQDYDVKNTSPVTGSQSTLFPTVFSPYCPTSLMTLTNNWTALNAKVGAMTATGTTNQTIGLAWGWLALTSNGPLNAPAPPAGTSRVIVLMTDGLNTENRWTTNQADIDARTQLVCNNIKADNITIYAVLVRMGDSPVLQDCTGNSSQYFVVNDSAGLTAAFNTIAGNLSQIRLAN